jgi:hypothetical protein
MSSIGFKLPAGNEELLTPLLNIRRFSRWRLMKYNVRL